MQAHNSLPAKALSKKIKPQIKPKTHNPQECLTAENILSIDALYALPQKILIFVKFAKSYNLDQNHQQGRQCPSPTIWLVNHNVEQGINEPTISKRIGVQLPYQKLHMRWHHQFQSN